MITRVPFGDWSEDGHKVHADVWVSIPEWDSIPKAQEKIKQKYGQDFFKTTFISAKLSLPFGGKYV